MNIKNKYIKRIWEITTLEKPIIENAKAQGTDLETWTADELRKRVAEEVAKHVTIYVERDDYEVAFFAYIHIIDNNQAIRDMLERQKGGEE